MKITAFELKLALLEYYRFERQWVAVDEFMGADVIVDTGVDVIEVEVKLNKNDLQNGERYKRLKHLTYREGRKYKKCHPNRFLFCVPTGLTKCALTMVQELNPKYGVIIFDDQRLLGDLGRGYRAQRLSDYLCTIERAQQLHTGYPEKQRQRIAMRCSSKLITTMQDKYKEKCK